EVVRGVEWPEPSLADQTLVHCSEPAREGRVDGNAERDGLAVHGPARRDDQIREGDETLRVDRVLGDEERGEAGRGDRALLLARPREHDGVDTSIGAEPLDHVREERVLVAVVERDLRWRADDDEHATPIELELVE